MASPSSMIELACNFQWTHQLGHHSVRCCVAKEFILSTLCCGYCQLMKLACHGANQSLPKYRQDAMRYKPYKSDIGISM